MVNLKVAGEAPHDHIFGFPLHQSNARIMPCYSIVSTQVAYPISNSQIRAPVKSASVTYAITGQNTVQVLHPVGTFSIRGCYLPALDLPILPCPTSLPLSPFSYPPYLSKPLQASPYLSTINVRPTRRKITYPANVNRSFLLITEVGKISVRNRRY